MHIFVVYLRIYLTKSSVMLIEFSVGNYLSIKDKKTLSLEASSITEHKGNHFKVAKYNLLRSLRTRNNSFYLLPPLLINPFSRPSGKLKLNELTQYF